MSSLSEISWPLPPAGAMKPFEYPSLDEPKPPRSWITPLAQTEPKEDAQSTRERRAREKGIEEGELRARAVFEESLMRERAEIAHALGAFQRERREYFERLEREAVQLVLVLTRKVLCREAETNVLALSSVVRDAISHLESGTKLMLRVHPSSGQEWRQFLKSSLDRHPVEVIEDASVSTGQCVIQSNLGEALIDFDARLKEVEEEIFELASQVAEPRRQVIQ